MSHHNHHPEEDYSYGSKVFAVILGIFIVLLFLILKVYSLNFVGLDDVVK